MMARRYRQVVDLYTTGKVVPLKDGTPLWVQPLNPFEQDTARNEAMIAKSRISLAIKEFGSDEMQKVRMFFFEDGIKGAVEMLVEAKMSESTPKIFEAIRIDPEWTERVKIIDRGAADTAMPLEETERKLLTQAANEFAAELGKRLNDEREYLLSRYSEMSEEALWEEYLEWFINRRAADVAMAEFKLHQMLYGVRWCDGEQRDGAWTHDRCNAHQDRFFTAKEDVRSAPDELLEVLAVAVEDIDMTVREAKNSRRQGSSFGSSPLPSEEVESTASTPTATPAEPHGSSLSPSVTDSLSSVGLS